ncbi:MAG: methyltransferase domain-containing protein [Magnetococcales bacterium]|nr:methyltransferase domain-containing protein [Magnetococcales bacterium]
MQTLTNTLLRLTARIVPGLRVHLEHIQTRRALLTASRKELDQTPAWMESCIPSYCHDNGLASYAAWNRLFVAADFHKQLALPGPMLDFGAGSGELARLLPAEQSYHFIEEDPQLSWHIRRTFPQATETTLNDLPREHYAAILCLDSLEHNQDYEAIVRQLIPALRPGGVLIVSGPTENLLYRIGRRIAGFSGHYHQTNIGNIEQTLARHLVRIRQKTVPWGIPLFSITAWRNAS